MFVISDFPPYVIDQIVGVQDASYVVIKLWLCGNSKLNDKLSKGLTFLDLKCHPLGRCKFPRLISQLVSLRHLAIFSFSNLVETFHDWPKIMRSLPHTLEYLAITSYDFDDCIWNSVDVDHVPETTYTRGKSHAIEFETLFPRLHTLVIHLAVHLASVSPELIPALPASLTRLDAGLGLSYKNGSENNIDNDGSVGDGSNQSLTISHLSRLPPNIVHLGGPISWSWTSSEGFDAMSRDFANAPPSLQTINLCRALPWKRDTDDDEAAFEYWLPKSLVELDWSHSYSPHWSPTLARTMPSQLHTLHLGHIDLRSFDNTYTNWIADLPRSLTSFTVHRPQNSSPLDFVKYGQFLPPKLTHLSFSNAWRDRVRGRSILGNCSAISGFSSGTFGDWSAISGDNYWPSTLKSLKLERFWVEPSAIVNLPKTLETLLLGVSMPAELQERPPLRTSDLPPNLTSLDLTWSNTVAINITLIKFQNLLECRLKLEASDSYALQFTEVFNELPESLTTLKLLNISLTVPTTQGSPISAVKLPKLTSLEVSAIESLDLIKFLPRDLLTLDIDWLGVELGSSLWSDGYLFKEFPPNLNELAVDLRFRTRCDIPIPAQSLLHFPLLKSLCILSTPNMPSNILRLLPRALTHLQLELTEWHEDDLPYLPPQLHTFYFETPITPKVVEYMSLRSLASLNKDKVSSEVWKVAKNRVLQASQNQ